MIVIGFAGCNDFGGKSKEDELIVFREMNRSLENSNKTIDRSNKNYLISLESKLYQDFTKTRAEIWKPKADSIQIFSDELNEYIEELKVELMKFSGQKTTGGSFDENNTVATKKVLVGRGRAKELLRKINEYKLSILKVDTLVKEEFQNNTVLDSSLKNISLLIRDSSLENYFNKSSSIQTLNKLIRFQNDIRNAEAAILDFCDRKVSNICIDCTGIDYFIGTNALYFKPGQDLNITAGIGEFTKIYHHVIKIDNKNIEVGWDGTAQYITKVGKPGKYSKKVEISFTKPDGTPSTLTKIIEYEVADCPK